MWKQKKNKYSNLNNSFANESSYEQLSYTITQIKNEPKHNKISLTQTVNLDEIFGNDKDLEQQLIEATIQIENEKKHDNSLKRKQKNNKNLEITMKKAKSTKLTQEDIDIIKNLLNMKLQNQPTTSKYKNTI